MRIHHVRRDGLRLRPATAVRTVGSLGLALCLTGAVPATAGEVMIDGVAAQVGSDIVLVSEVNQMAAPIEERMLKAGMPADEIMSMREDVLDRLIESRLIAEVVRRLELSASEDEVTRAIEGIAREAGLTVAQLEQSVAGHGLTRDEYRAKIRSEIERSKVLNSTVRQRVKIEPEEVEILFQQEFADQPEGGEEVHVRHLLVAFGPQFNRDQFTACGIVETARERIVSGEISFAAAATELSDANPQRGGDMGWIHSRELAGWMGPVIDELDVGDVSDVIETRFGCNLLTIEERRDFQRVTFEQAKMRLENVIFRQKMEAEYTAWVDTLREQTYIERKGAFGHGAGGSTIGDSNSSQGPTFDASQPSPGS
jgi:peptidyl-prolyl cis-trans isomerase SurA